MGLKEILERIREETELKRQEIIDRAVSERDRILKDAEDKAKEILTKAEEEKVKLLEQKVNSLVAEHTIKLNIQLSAEKRKILDDVYKRAMEKVKNDKKTYASIISYLFESLELKGNEKIYVGEEEEVVNNEFIDFLNKTKGWNLEFAGKRPEIRDGFLAVGEKSYIDASFVKLLEILKEETEVHLSKILFE